MPIYDNCAALQLWLLSFLLSLLPVHLSCCLTPLFIHRTQCARRVHTRIIARVYLSLRSQMKWTNSGWSRNSSGTTGNDFILCSGLAKIMVGLGRFLCHDYCIESNVIYCSVNWQCKFLIFKFKMIKIILVLLKKKGRNLIKGFHDWNWEISFIPHIYCKNVKNKRTDISGRRI